MNSNDLLIALAQVPAVDGKIEQNLRQHVEVIKQAAKRGADLIVFPELSLTGYSIAQAKELSLEPKDSVLRALSEAAVIHQITVIAGCFLQQDLEKPTINAVICKPTGEQDYYAKQYLHGEEVDHCLAGMHNYCLRIKGYKLALAVCADFAHAAHNSEACEDEADIYLASALISGAGYQKDSEMLANIARKYCFPVLMVNYIGPTGSMVAAGGSAAWNHEGELTYSAPSEQAELGLIEINGQSLSGRGYAIEQGE